VCLGTTVVLLLFSAAALLPEGASRVIQGIVTGIGFIGVGSILKFSEEHLVHGLTASARIWTTAAVGVAIGLGQIGLALITAVLTIQVLAVLAAVERRPEKRPRSCR
jgi:putative Mg2+ transporter-C (MgtC) family protein